MDDLMNKLQSVLNDEESMKQIQELAGMLASSSDSSPQAPSSQNNSTANSNTNSSSDGFDFSKLLQGLNLGGNNSAPSQTKEEQSSANGFDIGKIMQLQSIMQQTSKPDKNIDLLLALRPLLKEENQLKIDRLVKIFKLFTIYPVLKNSGLLGGDLFGLL